MTDTANNTASKLEATSNIDSGVIEVSREQRNVPAIVHYGDVPPVVEMQNIEMTYKARGGNLFKPTLVRALDKVNFSISRGETVGIVGESGCGKSTLAKIMIGLQKPTKGKVLFNGEPMKHDFKSRRQLGRSLSVVFQDPATALNPRMNVHDQLIDPLNIHKIGTPESRERKVRELLSLVGLPESALGVLPRQISGGQRQRVAIARALTLDPDIMVADEPTSALDVSVRAQVLNLLTDLKESLGLGMVFISHDINTVRYVADRIVVMYFGHIVETGPAEQIFADPKDPYTKKLLAATPSLLDPGRDK